MDDPCLEEKFSADVDRLLKGRDPEERNTANGKYSRLLITARELADLDLSPQSRIRSSLRRRLVDEWNAKARSAPKKNILREWFARRTVQVASVLLFAVGIALLVGLSSENAVQTVSGRISEIFRVGVPSQAVPTAPDGLDGSTCHSTSDATGDSVAYWDMRWGYITLFGTMGGVQ